MGTLNKIALSVLIVPAVLLVISILFGVYAAISRTAASPFDGTIVLLLVVVPFYVALWSPAAPPWIHYKAFGKGAAVGVAYFVLGKVLTIASAEGLAYVGRDQLGKLGLEWLMLQPFVIVMFIYVFFILIAFVAGVRITQDMLKRSSATPKPTDT